MKMLLIALACTPAVFAQWPSAHRPESGLLPPALVHKVEAKYTPEAKAKGLEGATTLAADISAEGVPVNIKVVKPLDPGLDASAVEAFKQWRFRPGEKDGKAVSVTATVQFRFRIEKFSAFEDPSLKPEAPPIPDDSLLWW